jgi:hypothetical protein
VRQQFLIVVPYKVVAAQPVENSLFSPNYPLPQPKGEIKDGDPDSRYYLHRG